MPAEKKKKIPGLDIGIRIGRGQHYMEISTAGEGNLVWNLM
jgi:hypothetical protein